MLQTLAIENYRSLRDLVLPLGRLNLVTGANGSGKSNLYRGLQLLARTARGGLIAALAAEGGLPSCFWAGPESHSRGMRDGSVPIQGGPRREPVRLRLGFAGEEFSYAIALGLPTPSTSMFALDPEIKHEAIWAGTLYRPASSLVEREGPQARVREGRGWQRLGSGLPTQDSLFEHLAGADTLPEVARLREQIRQWRFYDHFRSDVQAPARHPQLGTRTPRLGHDGADLAAALQTIREIGDGDALDEAIDDAFPGARLSISSSDDTRFSLRLHQHGLLRPLSGAELSDGTLRYLLWMAALLSPRPPPLMVLNEPETSLHPDLLPALGRLIRRAALVGQVWVVSHASRLIATLEADPDCQLLALQKSLGRTELTGRDELDLPGWRWPD